MTRLCRFVGVAALAFSLAACKAFSSKSCEGSVEFKTNTINVIKPQEVIYKRLDGTELRILPVKNHLLVNIPESVGRRILGFAQMHQKCKVSVFIDGTEIEQRNIVNLLPLSTVGSTDRFLSLSVVKQYYLSSHRPIWVLLVLKGEL